jgi:hypothetical protein
MNTTQHATPLTDLLKHEMVWQAMREISAGVIRVDFDGSGDSGEITDSDADRYPEGFVYNDHASVALGVAYREHTLSESYADLDLGLYSETNSANLTALVERLSADILGGPEIPDWVNSDGGFGTVRWIAAHTDADGVAHPDTIEVEVNIRVVQHETHGFTYDRFGKESAPQAASDSEDQ